jgi:hypothetical protein
VDRNIRRYPEFSRFRSVVADLITDPALAISESKGHQT